jgi:hypothetical protein
MAEKKQHVDTLSAEPVKGFFVDMLTRDIQLEDAILDLLDNCVDGVVRVIGKAGLRKDTPYDGYLAEISLASGRFSITDNCGGIPDDRRTYAFRMGSPPKGRDLKLPTVGTYGIGMKRAMFKLGRNCVVESKTSTGEYAVTFPPRWFTDENDWRVDLSHGDTSLSNTGTRITVTAIRDGVKEQLASEGFVDRLRTQIATHYALILAKGFVVKINDKPVSGMPLQLRLSSEEKGIHPFIYKTVADGVEVFLAVGFTMPIPSEKEANSDAGEMSQGVYQSAEAGWSVVCNDRTVLYCDKTALTGWGEGTVPRYHNQFIAIAGIVEFRSDDASKLPMTTTKRGIDASSGLYLDIKNKMREGMKLFTDFTNRWKGPELAAQAKGMIRDAEPIKLPELKAKAAEIGMRSLNKRTGGEQYKPKLPTPPEPTHASVRIQYARPREQVELLAERLFGDSETAPTLVGEKCFDLILGRSR